jgi:hypothetical protein
MEDAGKDASSRMRLRSITQQICYRTTCILAAYMFKRILSSSVLLLLMAMQVLAAELTGTVTDKEGLPVPFVTVYVEGTTLGTTTNAEGRYQLELKPGYHIIVFRYVGYGTEIRPVTIEADMKLDVEMKRVVFELGEAVADGSEDPAYRIMRMARGKREFYRQQVQDYSCKVYVKGTNFVKNLPKRVLGRSLDVPGLDATRSGIIYLSESVSEFHFKAPNVTKERVIASKVSGRSEGFTWNNATSLQFNFYDKSYNLEGLSDRNLVSPIAPSATLYYRFKYAGFYIEDSIIVNRIEVIPRATGVPLFKGFIFIQDGSWRIHGVDVFLTSESGIEFVDTVRMKADFIPTYQRPVAQRHPHLRLCLQCQAAEGERLGHIHLGVQRLQRQEVHQGHRLSERAAAQTGAGRHRRGEARGKGQGQAQRQGADEQAIAGQAEGTGGESGQRRVAM